MLCSENYLEMCMALFTV